jgi:hypothetical protein
MSNPDIILIIMSLTGSMFMSFKMSYLEYKEKYRKPFGVILILIQGLVASPLGLLVWIFGFMFLIVGLGELLEKK